MAESNGKKRALVVIDSDDDEAPLAPWVRTVSDQAEVADIIEIKDEEEEDDDDLFEKEMNVQYGSSPSRVKKEKKPKPDPSPGGGGGPSGGGGGTSPLSESAIWKLSTSTARKRLMTMIEPKKTSRKK